MAQAVSHQLVVCDAKVRLQVLETKGSEQNLKLLQAGKVDLVSYLFEDLFQIVVTEKSGIEQIADLKGKRIAIPPVEDRADDFFWILLQHYRLARQDVQVQSMTGEAADEAFLNNSIDAVFRSRPAGNKFIQKLVRQGRARIIPIDQAAALRVQYPEFAAAILPKGVYQGNVATPAQDLATIAVRRILVAMKEQFARNQKNRGDLDNNELIQIMDDVNNCNDIDSLDKINRIVYQKFAIAIEAYDCDRITFEALQSIRFTWDATRSAIQDCQAYLLR